jgi:hypothetical protein
MLRGFLVVCVGALVLAGGGWAAQDRLSGTFGDGTHRVGVDVKPATYRSKGGNYCYWARLRSFSGELGAILANDNPRGPVIVTIKRTDRGFESGGCGRWTSNLARVTASTTRFGQGTFLVGVDVAPGTYRARGGSYCYYARLRAFTGDLGAIIANDNPRGATIVTISRTDKGFMSQGCGTWSRA